ncbi:MAG: hypothetical protein ACW98Y_13730 [Candidatus Thorarchaeota archaeon]|jgi:hypothetical protein
MSNIGAWSRRRKIRRCLKIGIVCIIGLMLVCVDFETAMSQPNFNNAVDKLSPDELLRQVAEQVDPKRPYSLRELVEELMNVTPAGTPDVDSDGLPDPVEVIIGTDYNSSDTDLDSLSDYFEVFNGADPLEADTNFDGFPDKNEFNVSTADIDQDGISNVWDPDNDGDNVNDIVDLSPFAKSISNNSFHLDIETDGNPLYIDIQFRPNKEEHLKLVSQKWDWPYDEEGMMRDLDNSTDDIFTQPLLRIQTNQLPNQTEVDEYGISIVDDYLFVPVFPVWDKDDIVALKAKIFYPSSTASSISLDIEFYWRILGETDNEVQTLSTLNDDNLTFTWEGLFTINETESSSTELTFIEIDDDHVALKIGTGQFVSINENQTLIVGGFEIGDMETFTVEKRSQDEVSLRGYNGEFVTVQTDGSLALDPIDVSSYYEQTFRTSSASVESETILLVTYPDSFYCTGFIVEEFSKADLAFFYSTNRNQTIAANMRLSAEFLRNNTNHVDTVNGILVSSGITVSNPKWQFTHRDEALIEMSNVLLPAVLDGLPDNQSIPLILATEEESKVIEMSEISPGTYLFGSTLSMDLTSEPTATIKSMKTNFYNTSSYNALSFQDIILNTNEWGLDDNASIALTSLLMVWNAGEQVISGDGRYTVDFAPPDSSIASTASTVAASLITLGIIVSAKLSSQMSSSFRALSVSIGKVVNFFKLINQGWAFTDAFQAVKGIQSAYKAGDSAPKFWGKFDTGLAIIGILIDVGFSIYAGIAIASAIGGKLGVEIGATYGTVSAVLAVIVGVAIWALGMWNPLLGVILGITYALGSIFGNWLGELSRVITEAFVGPPHTTCEVTPYYDIVSTDVTIQDWNELGFNVGDRIDFTAEIAAGLNATGNEWWHVDRSYNKAWLTTILPAGSSSTNTSYHTQEYPIPAGGLPDEYTSYSIQAGDGDWYYVENTCTSTVTVAPGTAMVNFPLNVRFNHYSRLTTRWYHRPFWLFGERCSHYDTSEISNTSAFTTMYFDVFPSTLHGFRHWSAITPLDHDGDGLHDSEEPAHRIWNYDSDSDGLNDKFEIENGFDPDRFDSDYDGLSDEWEYHYGTDAMNSDSDGDGLRDYRELAGWEVTFTYNNTPFTIHVFSDPRRTHSDNDTLNDFQEYWSNTNPRSFDTNGDGTQDEERLMSQTELEFEKSWGANETYDTWSLELAIDDSDDIYLLETDAEPDLYGDLISSAHTYWAIRKFSSDLNETSTGAYFDPLTGGNPDYYRSICLDTNNSHVYSSASEAFPGWVDVYLQCNLTGTSGVITNPSPSGASSYEIVRGMDVDTNGNLYSVSNHYTEGGSFWVLRENSYSGGTLTSRTNEWLMTDLESSVGDLGFSFRDVAYDERSGLLFVLGSSRVLGLDPTGVEDPFVFEGSFSDPRGICVDENGFIYVLDGAIGACDITAYDSNGEKFPFFGDNGTIALNPFFDGLGDDLAYDLVIDSLGNFYVCGTNETWDESTGWENLPMLLKLSPGREAVSDFLDPDIDSDFDLLTNYNETSGWEISITFSNGTSVFNVTSNPLLKDTDKDTLTDYDEWLLGTNPNMPDSDGDSVRDDVEIALGLDPKHFDSDRDLLPDGIELTYGSNPNSGDSDGEGVPDSVEFSLGSNSNSSDSDGDGMDDNDEFDFNSSLLSPDADNDFMFDGMENQTGTDPNQSDDDLDGVKDGLELLYGTDATSNDTDGDGIGDGIEIDLWLNPLSSDTDMDGLSDLEELELSTNPWMSDSDFDGILDGVDEDSYLVQYLDVTLVVSSDINNDTLEFLERLGEFCNLSIVDYDDFMTEYTQSKYIILVGRPDSDDDEVAGLIHDLLAEAGEVLTSMAVPNAHEIVVRYGIWEPTQTVVMLSCAIPFDVYSVLSILRGRNVTVFTDGIQIDYNTAHSEHHMLDLTTLTLGSIDIVKRTDATLSITLSSQLTPSIILTRYNTTTVPHVLGSATGLLTGEESLGQYLEVSITVDGTSVTSVEEALIIIYYKDYNLDRNGNGLLNDSMDLNESTLVLYVYDESTSMWVRLTDDLEWVVATGVNTTDIMVYGEIYAGYVWARVTHLSLFGVAGQLYAVSFPWSSIILIGAAIGAVVIVSLVIHRKRGTKEYAKHEKIVTSLKE